MLSVTPRAPPPSDPAGPYRVCLGDRERVLALPDVPGHHDVWLTPTREQTTHVGRRVC